MKITGVLLLELVKHILDLLDQIQADALHININLPLHLVSECSFVHPCDFVGLAADIALIEVVAHKKLKLEGFRRWVL